MYATAIVAFSAFVAPSLAAYEKVWDYNSNNFFESFELSDKDDTWFTSGFAQYLDQDDATRAGLASMANNRIRLAADSTNKYSTSSSGRNSVRATSWGYFDNGLLIADMNHVPEAGCGMWPAFWIYQGEQEDQTYSEVDIFENVNRETQNVHSLYTSEKCTVNVNKGSIVEGYSDDCTYNMNDRTGGCKFWADQGTFGKSFNDQYKVIAFQVESDRLKIWHFKKNEVPSDINSKNPNPDNWKSPTLHISPKSCNFVKAWRQFHIVLNITFCGGWAGGDWDWNQQCAALTKTDCKSWVANNPADFKNTYFDVNYIRLFQRT